MRLLFLSFARGLPGLGLLLMRVVTGSALIVDAVGALQEGPSIQAAIPRILAGGAGILLLIGLWTPLAGVLAAILTLWAALKLPQNPLISILLATLSAALTLLGPGAWSVDARLFGWKRIEIPDREHKTPDS